MSHAVPVSDTDFEKEIEKHLDAFVGQLARLAEADLVGHPVGERPLWNTTSAAGGPVVLFELAEHRHPLVVVPRLPAPIAQVGQQLNTLV